MASADGGDDDPPLGLFSGVWSRLRATGSVWRRRGGNEVDLEATVRSRLARRRLGRKLAFVSFNLEVLVFIYALWRRARRRNFIWRQPIQTLPMLVIPALATFIYAAFIRFTRTLDLKDNKMIQKLQQEKQANDCVPRKFDQDEQNSAKKYDCTDDPSNFPAAAVLEETSKPGTSQQPGIILRHNGGGDIAWDHTKDFKPTHSDVLLCRRFSIEETCTASSNAVIQPIDWLSEHVADDPEHPDDTPRNVGHHCNSGTDIADNTIIYSSVETATYLHDCDIVNISSNTMDHAERISQMNNPKYNRWVAEEDSVQMALTGPMSNLPAFAELLDEGIQENKSSKLHVSEESEMPSISKTELLVGSYTVKNTEHLGTSGFSLCSQQPKKKADAGDVSPELTFLSSPELVVEGSKYAIKKESCELNTQDENDIVVYSEEVTFVVSIDEQCSGTPGFFLHAQDSNMMEIPAVVNIVADSPEPNYPAPVGSLKHALDNVDFKGGETCNAHLPEQKGQEVLLDPLVDSYEGSFDTSKLLSQIEAAKMAEVPGEDLSETHKGASNHESDVAVSLDCGGNTDNTICGLMPVQLITESNIMDALRRGQETLSDPIHHSSSHSSGIFVSSSKVTNDGSDSSNSDPYFLHGNSMQDESPLADHGGCSESQGGTNFTFLDTPILLNEVVASAESWTDNARCSQFFRDNTSTESLHDDNQVQNKTSERANFGLEGCLISSEEGIKTEIFSLYSRSSSCVSDLGD